MGPNRDVSALLATHRTPGLEQIESQEPGPI